MRPLRELHRRRDARRRNAGYHGAIFAGRSWSRFGVGGRTSTCLQASVSGASSQSTSICARTIEMNEFPLWIFRTSPVASKTRHLGPQGEIRFESFDFGTTISADKTIGGMRYDAVFGVEEIVTLLRALVTSSLCTLAANLDIPCELPIE